MRGQVPKTIATKCKKQKKPFASNLGMELLYFFMPNAAHVLMWAIALKNSSMNSGLKFSTMNLRLAWISWYFRR
jgi:hypothetical protein